MKNSTGVMVACLAVLLVFPLSFFAAARASAETSLSPFGITVDHYNVLKDSSEGGESSEDEDSSEDDLLDDLIFLGVRWIRSPVPYLPLELKKGNLLPESAANVIDMRHEAGLHQIMLIQAGKELPKDIPGYRQFIKRVVDKYGPGTPYDAHYFQVQNEPNMRIFWQYSDDERAIEDYARLLKITSEVARAANPDVKIVLGSVAFSSTAGFKSLYPKFFADVFSQYLDYGTTGKNYFDVVDLHLYGFIKAMEEDLEQFRELMQANNIETPILCTEFGINSTGPETEEVMERKQACHLVQAYISMVGLGVEKLCWFSLIDRTVKTGDDGFCHMGLMKPDGSRKPAFHSYRYITHLLRKVKSGSIEEVTVDEDVSCWRLTVRAQDHPLYVVWSTAKEEKTTPTRLRLKGLNGEVRITALVPTRPHRGFFDKFERRQGSADNGTIAISLDEIPVLIESIQSVPGR